jgi:hypothetical protein
VTLTRAPPFFSLMADSPPEKQRGFIEAFWQDPIVEQLWAAYCEQLLPLGIDPSNPSPDVTPFFEFVRQNVVQSIPVLTASQMRTWAEAAPDDLRIRVDERKDVAERVERVWGDALRLLDQLLSVSEELGMIFVNRLVAVRGNWPLTLRVLVGLHTRGVQVGEEVLVLLRNGFAAGGEGRWRTLHEIAVVGAFIAKHGEDTAERYILHNGVQVERSMRLEQRYHEKLRIEPYSQEEMKAAKADVNALRKRFGKVFETDYGWAAAALRYDPKDRRGPTFAELEASLEAAHFRPVYSSASHAIHASVLGLLQNPGQDPERTPVFNTRGTEFGLSDAGMRVAGSLYMLARSMIMYWSLPFDMVGLKAFSLLGKEAVTAFKASEQALDELSPEPPAQDEHT